MPKRKKNKKRQSMNSKKEEQTNKENNEIEIKNEIKNEEDNNSDIDKEEKNDLLKITNIEYEKFIKINEKFIEYLSNPNQTIIIHSQKFDSEIDLKNNSLLKIIRLANLDNELKKYLTIQIISEKINIDTYSSKNLTFNPKIGNYLNVKKEYNITFPSNKTSISLNKKVLEKIFSLLNMNYSDDIFNYIEFIVTQISYKFEKTQKSYILKGAKNLKKLIEQNKIFYFLLKINEEHIPLSNYSTQKIFNLINGGKDTKYLLINYKIKNDELINMENQNKLFLNNIINASDVNNIKIKYKTQVKNNEFKALNNEKLDRIKEINISELNSYLFQISDKLTNINTQITNKKEEIEKLAENDFNQIILINLEGKNIFINKQYLHLFQKKNIVIMDIYDYTNEKISLSQKYLDNIEEDNIYIEIIYDNKKFLVKKNYLLKLFDGWKVLNQSENIDVIDTNGFDNIRQNFELQNIKINQQEEIQLKHLDNFESNDNKKKVFEYVDNLPRKNIYKIKYKIKVKRIPKDKRGNS